MMGIDIIRRLKGIFGLPEQVRYLVRLCEDIPSLREKVGVLQTKIALVDRRVELLQEAVGRIELRQLDRVEKMKDSEFRVFSQWGEDGIIQFLTRNVDISKKVFVEFGVDQYDIESNTRFLLAKDNWAGLIIDRSKEAIEKIKQSPTYWLYNLKAVEAFITKDNINEILEENGVTGEIGLLSIDVDGNDYWIWEAINVVSPIIVIIEYNYRFGVDHAVTIPYDEGFDKNAVHKSGLYFGASLKALCQLGQRKGYSFVGCNSNGVNAFFVRKDKLKYPLKELSPEEGFVRGSFSEKGDRNDKLLPEEEVRLLKSLDLPLVWLDAENSNNQNV